MNMSNLTEQNEVINLTHIENHVSPHCSIDGMSVSEHAKEKLYQVEIARLNAKIERQKTEMVAMQVELDALRGGAAMKERPILFNAEMVNAILEGRKTQTRRVIKDETKESLEIGYQRGESFALDDPRSKDCKYIQSFCPLGEIGDRLWVRETFTDSSGTGVEYRDSKGKLQRYAYAADCPKGSHGDEMRKEFGVKWAPSIHMPRSASRITLEITNIRVERLNDISIEDSLKEGITHRTMNCPRHEYFQLWNSINGEMAHEKNPWVWVIEFEVVKGGAL